VSENSDPAEKIRFDQIQISKEGLLAIDFDFLGDPPVDLVTIWKELNNLSSKHILNGETQIADLYYFISCAASLYLRPDDLDTPLRPFIETPTGRSLVVADFTNDQLAVLKSVTQQVRHQELKARFADIVWIRLKDFTAACCAIETYLSIGLNPISSLPWRTRRDYIERAAIISRSLGSKSEVYQNTKTVISHTYHKEKHNIDSPFLPLLVTLLLNFQCTDYQDYYQSCMRFADHYRSESDLHNEHYYVCLALQCARHLDGLFQDETLTRKSAIEKDIGDAFKDGSVAAASHWYQKAIHTLSGLKDKSRIPQDLINSLHITERNIRKHMVSISTPIELPEEVKSLLRSLSDAPVSALIAAYFDFATHVTKSMLLNELHNHHNDNPLLFYISKSLVRTDGSTCVTLPPIPDIENANQEDIDLHLWALMRDACHPQAYICESIRKDLLEHKRPALTILEDLVGKAEFIDHGSKEIVQKGVISLLHGDYVSAAHLLVPQFERFLRNVLQFHGVFTRRQLDNRSEEHGLSWLLRHELLFDIYGEDCIFFLKGFLIEDAALNLRNNTAHGLLTDADFSSCLVIVGLPCILKLMLVTTNGGINTPPLTP